MAERVADQTEIERLQNVTDSARAEVERLQQEKAEANATILRLRVEANEQRALAEALADGVRLLRNVSRVAPTTAEVEGAQDDVAAWERKHGKAVQ